MRTTINPLHLPDYDSAYWAVKQIGDVVYFALCTHVPGKTAGCFAFDLATGKVRHLWDVADVVESDAAAQHGKIHTPLLEGSDQRLYFGTHFAYPYGMPQDVEYEGGRFLALDPASGSVQDFGIPSPGDGIITCALDVDRMVAYLLSVPGGHLVACDIATGQFRAIGTIPSNRSICRSLAVDDDGNLYGSYEDLGVFIYEPSSGQLRFFDNALPASTTAEWEGVYRRGVNNISRNLWRCVEYDRSTNSLLGVLATTSDAFVFDCESRRATTVGSLLPNDFPAPDRCYPTLSLTTAGTSLFYAPAPGFFDYERSEQMRGWSALIELNPATRDIHFRGAIEGEDGRRVHGVAAAGAGADAVHMIGAVEAMPGEEFDERLQIDGQPFGLGLISVTLP